jgi:glutamyl-Q tRNA(Asp) synthetase
VGDFVLLRADGLIAYQLAVVVDDAFQRVTDIVRGADLLSSTPRQIQVQRALALPTPRYFHVPVAEVAPGSKLSKQTLAPALDADRAGMTLWKALQFLGQEVPFELRGAPVEEIWHWAFSQWRPDQVPRVPGQVAPPIGDVP